MVSIINVFNFLKVQEDIIANYGKNLECYLIIYLAALIDERILCMNGGLSPDLKNIDQVNRIKRLQEIPEQDSKYF